MPPRKGKKGNKTAAAKAKNTSSSPTEGTSSNGVEEELNKDEQEDQEVEEDKEVQNEVNEENEVEEEADEENDDESDGKRASKRSSSTEEPNVGGKKAKKTNKIPASPKMMEGNGVNVKELRSKKPALRSPQTKAPAHITAVKRKTTVAKSKSKKTSNNAGLQQFEVESILNVKKKSGKRQFLVKWKGYTSKENTWEPEENLNCPQLLSTFLKKKGI